jgi:hypothetical protein
MKVNNTLIEVKPGFKFAVATLKVLLPDVETALFFGKTYKLDAYELGELLRVLFNTDVIQALTGNGSGHSLELQDYLVEVGYEYLIQEGAVSFDEAPVYEGEILPELWRSFELTIASSITEVAEKLKDVVGAMPGKEGQMLFRSMMVLNSKRPTIGDHRAYVHHKPKPENLFILDVSGSMSEKTVATLVEDFVAMGYMADAYLAIVSSTTTWWMPGECTVASILEAAEYQGTHYETLSELMDRNWGVVVTIADYDSSPAAKDAIKDCRGSIELLLDISLVGRPTYLSEVVGQLAQEVRPLLVAANDHCCMH